MILPGKEFNYSGVASSCLCKDLHVLSVVRYISEIVYKIYPDTVNKSLRKPTTVTVIEIMTSETGDWLPMTSDLVLFHQCCIQHECVT